jgi:hypothetical protein
LRRQAGDDDGTDDEDGDADMAVTARGVGLSIETKSDEEESGDGDIDSEPNVALHEFTAGDPDRFEALSMFDSEDLSDEGIFVLQVEIRGTSQLDASAATSTGIELYVWIGEDVDVSAWGGAEGLLAHVQPRYEAQVILPAAVVSICVQRQGEESDDFWNGFVNG